MVNVKRQIIELKDVRSSIDGLIEDLKSGYVEEQEETVEGRIEQIKDELTLITVD